jgi:hypothetical protein
MTGDSVAITLASRYPCSLYVLCSGHILPVVAREDGEGIPMRDGHRVTYRMNRQDVVNAIMNFGRAEPGWYACWPKWKPFPEESTEGLTTGRGDTDPGPYMVARFKAAITLLEPIKAFATDLVHVLPLGSNSGAVRKITDGYLSNTECGFTDNRKSGGSVAFARGGRIMTMPGRAALLFKVLLGHADVKGEVLESPIGPGWKAVIIRLAPLQSSTRRDETVERHLEIDEDLRIDGEKAVDQMSSIRQAWLQDQSFRVKLLHHLLPGEVPDGECMSIKSGRPWRLTFGERFPDIMFHFPPDDDDYRELKHAWHLFDAWKLFKGTKLLGGSECGRKPS